MKIGVVGCGSIGTRRAKLLAEMGHEVHCWDTGDAAPVAHRLAGYPFVSVSAPESWPAIGVEAAFVCTPAHTHLPVAAEVLKAGCGGVFIEKPLSTSMLAVQNVVEWCDRLAVVTMGACNMRWAYPSPDPSAQCLALWTCGPLSGWRPGSDAYRDAGIVLESAVHDLDVACHWLGPVRDMDARGDEDKVTLNVEHERGRSVIVSDWSTDAKPTREMAWIGPRGTQVCQPKIGDDMYRQEMQHFLDHVASWTPTSNPIANAAETLRWALHARDLTMKVAA